ncbi:hypothetical protein Glove_275g72 [Diversispora epigaea]|uniref:TLDc domain-containing protein n=1 Tax=Diversispora epigaea TaxID=1348612 RepID=A0A397I372_9GLOM|nr:hypothetical protein Glove_275g72 [Diversispora epigaea]
MINISVKVFNIFIKYIYGGTISLENLENSIIFGLLTSSHELGLDELAEHLQTHLFIKHVTKYIYGGTISLENLENSIIFGLLTSSHELGLDELAEHLQTHLVNTNNASWLKLNFAQVYQTCYQVKNFDIIQKFCNNIIAKHPNTIFESEKFISLPEDALISIIKLDDLQLDEDKIWDYIIQWGTNPDEWTSDYFVALKTTLKNCLPHVDISILQPIPSIPSNIITNEHASELSSWIDRKEATYTENNPYEFKLLVRGSRDGFDVKTIYNICDQVSNTIIVAKLEGTGGIIGGYNPLEMHNTSQDSFVFSLKTENLKNSIICRVTNFHEEFEVFKVSPKK